MAGTLELEEIVRGLENGLGRFCPGERKTGEGLRSQFPVLYQVLEPGRFSVAFEPGGQTYQVLSNDQNRFSPPRSLPPILDFALPDDVDNPTGAYVLARYAYSEGAFQLLEDLLAGGHVFGMNGFLEVGWSLAKVLAFLHEHGIVHGQWNSKSVIAVPTEELSHPLLEVTDYRFEVINTGVCFQDSSAIPSEYVARGYYPPEVFLSEGGSPDYGALDMVGDVYCFAAFLKDLMQSACSSEELPSQAQRILGELQKEANRRGWKASPESLRRKEMEILDHLYTIRVRSETLIQEALRPRDERCRAAGLLDGLEDLHAKAMSYREELFARGFEPVNSFGEELQHYTTFQLTVSPGQINGYEDSRVVLTGSGLPHELVRVTLNETHQGVSVLSAQPGCIEFLVEHGFRSGHYRVSVNNRRTNGTLEVFSPVWKAIEPQEVHQPWEGFGNIRLCVHGDRLPMEAEYGLRTVGDVTEDTVPAVVVLPAELEEGTDDALQLTFPCDTAPGEYEVIANGLPTELRTRVLEQLPDPIVLADGVTPETVKNHCSRSLRLTGRNLHPQMMVDFGEGTPNGLQLSVISSSEALLEVPARFPAGEYRLRLNHRETQARLQVTEPRWIEMTPSVVKLMREQGEPISIRIGGECLPPPGEKVETGYTLRGRGEKILAGPVVAEEVEPERTHRLAVGPDLPRGQCRVCFGDLDTGLRLQIRRQLPRSAWVALLVVSIVLLGSAGFALRSAFAPRITGLDSASVYAFGQPVVRVRGDHLAAVELLDPDGQVIAGFPVQDLEEPETYEFVPRQTPAGKYRLRPVGSLYGSPPSDFDLTLLSPGFRLEPTTLHRLRTEELRIGAEAGFDVSKISSLQLHGLDSGELLEDLDVAEGRVLLPPGRLRAGQYAVAIDGMNVAGGTLQLRVVGPAVAAISPNPVSQDVEGWMQVSVDGEHLEPVPVLQEVDGNPEFLHPLESVGDGQYRSNAPPGRYRLVAALEGMQPEPLSELVLTVLPTPGIAEVSPSRLEPGTATEVTVRGTNLASLEQLVLQPLDGDLQAVEVPVDTKDVQQGVGAETYGFELSLQAGTWRVLPADGVLTLEVFADCQEALDAFASGGDPDALLLCLNEGRPPADVVRRAADLFFDRGMFNQARQFYEGKDDLVARFRSSFIDSFLRGRPVPLLLTANEERRTPYAVAAAKLGWSGARSGEFTEVALPWELEYVRGLTTTDPETAVASFRRSIEDKTTASGGHEIADFEPGRIGLAKAQLELALQLLRRVEIPRSRRLLQEVLEQDPSGLAVDELSLALFWYGHCLLWYEGDREAARLHLERARDLDGTASPWSREYLAALGTGQADDGQNGGPVWESTFTRVFRLFQEATDSPNYNLLATARDTGSYLSADERGKSAELRNLLQALDGLDPVDPFAHHALLHSVRTAQKVSWPAQTSNRLADEQRGRLEGFVIPPELEPLRRYYVVLGELQPYDFSQITSFSRSEQSAFADRIEELEGMGLPEPFLESAALLKKRFLNPSVIWWREINK